MSINFITIGLIYIIIGFGAALIFYYIFRKKFIGKIWGAILVGIIGSFIGGFIDVFLQNIWFFTLVFYSVNVIPPCILACLFLWIFCKISNSPEEY
jgi:uncharacterized membrane protein YeaQ/YmgE (transglycosylase-associated protein family)